MERGSLARVSKDFFTTIDGELSLAKGDYFLIHNVVDKHWYYGESRERRGKFPSNHLYKADVPDIQDSENLFISIAAFRGEQPGDLSFGEGEIIVGTQQVEINWYSGYIDSRVGIFPISHVWQLDTSILKKAGHKKAVRRRARVNTSLKAQLDEELDLREGEIVTVLEVLEDGWARGMSEEGKEGTFPEAFVTYLESVEMDNQSETHNCPRSSSGYSSMDSELMPNSSQRGKSSDSKDFGQASSMSSFEDPAPNYYDLFPTVLPSSSQASGSLRASQPSIEISEMVTDDNLNPLGVQPYAITLFPFKAQFPNELSFAEGEVVHLLKHLDSEWAEGRIDDARGFFPISYVNIIVDCTDVCEDPTQRVSHEAEARAQDRLEAGSSVKVEYTFDAQMDGDLSVIEAEIVTVVEMANDDWVSVKNAKGAIGLCPRAYLNPEIQRVSESSSELLEYDLVEDFVVMRRDEKPRNDEAPKRLSEPHRPAPPAPAPGRTPLLKQSITEKGSHPEPSGEDRSSAVSPTLSEKQKRADKRQNVISELVITEKEYVRDLKVTYETFNLYNPCLLESRGIDVATLFGNLLEVIQVAEELLDLVLRAMKGCDEDFQTIAPCFLKMSDKMQSVYGKYCANHEAALCLLKKYENDKDITHIFDKGIETLRRQVACFDMSSILIKPVQRILKYPLMLYELIKCTEENHPDREGIEEAWNAMTQVASRINEYKRRKDLVTKYLDEDNTLMRKMSKLTMHSVAKKSSRLSAKLSATLGVTNLPPDPIFDDLERQFKSLEKCTWMLAKDVDQCTNYLNEEAKCGEVLADLLKQYYIGTLNHEISQYQETRVAIQADYIQNLKATIDRCVNAPVNSLITHLEGPSMLITKRHDKLLDYDNAISKSDKNKESKIAQDELAVAKTTFEALNQQLLEELPVLIEAATTILANCIEIFAYTRKLLNGKIMKSYLTLSMSATQVSAQDIFKSFLVNHNLVWNQISRTTFDERVPDVSDTPAQLCPQNERQRLNLRRRYPPGRLYVTNQDIPSTSSLDLGVPKGTLVAVIKEQDPLGNSTRWFVDNGVAQGFLPSRGLQRVLPPSESSYSNQSSIDVADNAASMPDLMSLDSPEKVPSRSSLTNSQSNFYMNLNSETPPQPPQRYENVQPQYFYASYDFKMDKEGTLTVSKFQALKLIRTHDEYKNDEWWLMEDRHGNQGYVPRNYLMRGKDGKL